MLGADAFVWGYTNQNAGAAVYGNAARRLSYAGLPWGEF